MLRRTLFSTPARGVRPHAVSASPSRTRSDAPRHDPALLSELHAVQGQCQVLESRMVALREHYRLQHETLRNECRLILDNNTRGFELCAEKFETEAYAAIADEKR